VKEERSKLRRVRGDEEGASEHTCNEQDTAVIFDMRHRQAKSKSTFRERKPQKFPFSVISRWATDRHFRLRNFAKLVGQISHCFFGKELSGSHDAAAICSMYF
jgi:hypothetical protein